LEAEFVYFLPLLSRLGPWDGRGFDVLYICPLKALIETINEQ
jgi:hypothetical protein